MKDNKYPELFKIELVKRYLNGEMQKDICAEHGICKSTFWGWTQKYSEMILKEWKIEENDLSISEEFIDIRKVSEKVINHSVIHQSKDIIRIFVNGYAIICNVDNFEKVMKVINNG